MNEQLKKNGYVVIHNVLNDKEIDTATGLFNNWRLLNSPVIGPNGIIKENHIGHQEHAWYIRTRPSVINVFQDVWETDDLITSFDGSCYMSKTDRYDGYWTHADQSTINTDFRCYQGLVSLTTNKHKTLMVYGGTHLLYGSYVKQYNKSNEGNFNIIDEEYVKDKQKTIIPVEKGSMIIWDSRLFHQNQCGGPNNEERMVQYVCYMPRSYNTPENVVRRKYAFDNRITSSHWPVPIRFGHCKPPTIELFNMDPYMESILKIL